MKNTLILCMALVIGFNVYAQSKWDKDFDYKVLYELDYQLDSLDESSLKSETMVLLIGDTGSKFSSYGKHIKDSIFNVYKKKPRTQEIFAEYKSKVPEFNIKYDIYTNKLDNKLFFKKRIAGDKYVYIETLDNFDWDITSESKEMLGFKVIKAVTSYKGRDYIAWFTPEVPLPFGPYKFGNLPGLIIKIHDTSNHYMFELKAFRKLKKNITETLDMESLILIDRHDFYKLIEDEKKNPLALYESSGRSFNFSSTAQKERIIREYRERMKKQNNPIELE